MLVELPNEMTIAQVAALKPRLLAALEANGELLLDASAVSAVDCAGLQLIESAWRTAQARGCRIAFAPSRRSTVLDGAATAAGLATPGAAGPWLEG